MARIRELRETRGLLIHAARDAFLAEQGHETWHAFILANPMCASAAPQSPNDRGCCPPRVLAPGADNL